MASPVTPGYGPQTEVAIVDGKEIKVDLGASGDYPACTDLPVDLGQIIIGTIKLFAGGYPNVPPERTICKGVTARGCYLRVANVPKMSGGTGPACVQYCKEPPVRTVKVPDEKPPVRPVRTGTPAVLTVVADPYVVPKPRGAPAVLTVSAPSYVVPKPRGTPAVLTVSAPKYVVPKPRGTPAVPTVIAPSYVVPKPLGTPAVPTVIAPTYVVPIVNR